MPLIPAVLEFSGVARDASLSLTLTTDGAAWSIGGDDGDASEGFSYNGLALGENLPCCVTSIELTDSVLAIRTSLSSTATSFTLALFIDVKEEVESVQGYCDLNADARVVCQLGYDIAGEWRSGQFGAIIRPIPKHVRRVRLHIERAPVGAAIMIDLLAERSEGEAYWCFDSGVAGAPGLLLRAASGAALPLKTLEITGSRLVVIASGGQGQKVASDIFIEAYLRRASPSEAAIPADAPCKELKRFHLRATADGNASVVAQVGTQRPQRLAGSYRCFYF